MAIYEDFDLDITTGTKNDENGIQPLSGVNCYTDYATCPCTGDTCTGVRTRPCDR